MASCHAVIPSECRCAALQQPWISGRGRATRPSRPRAASRSARPASRSIRPSAGRGARPPASSSARVDPGAVVVACSQPRAVGDDGEQPRRRAAWGTPHRPAPPTTRSVGVGRCRAYSSRVQPTCSESVSRPAPCVGGLEAGAAAPPAVDLDDPLPRPDGEAQPRPVLGDTARRACTTAGRSTLASVRTPPPACLLARIRSCPAQPPTWEAGLFTTDHLLTRHAARWSPWTTSYADLQPPRPPLDALHPALGVRPRRRAGDRPGRGPYIWDAAGKRYLDGLAGLFVEQVGHGRDRARRGRRQAGAELAFFPLWSYAHPNAIELAERLADCARRPQPGLLHHRRRRGGGVGLEAGRRTTSS